MPSILKPVRRTTVVSSVREQLIALLNQRELGPGDLLPSERELASTLEVGRSSLREALAGMVALGILNVGVGKGYQVASLVLPPPVLPAGLSQAQIAELFEVRHVLELGIAELACARATEADFAALQECLDSIQRAWQSHRSTVPAAARFHTLLARAAHNGLLEKQLQGIRDLMVQVGGTTEQRYGSRFASEQWEAHKSLLDTLQQRDAAAMRTAMREHLERFADEAAPAFPARLPATKPTTPPSNSGH